MTTKSQRERSPRCLASRWLGQRPAHSGRFLQPLLQVALKLWAALPCSRGPISPALPASREGDLPVLPRAHRHSPLWRGRATSVSTRRGPATAVVMGRRSPGSPGATHRCIHPEYSCSLPQQPLLGWLSPFRPGDPQPPDPCFLTIRGCSVTKRGTLWGCRGEDGLCCTSELLPRNPFSRRSLRCKTERLPVSSTVS